MTHTEAAALILRASGNEMRNYTTQATRADILNATRADILAAVATVMDAARADAFEEAAKFLDHRAKGYAHADRVFAWQNVNHCAAAIRTLAQAHREPKP